MSNDAGHNDDATSGGSRRQGEGGAATSSEGRSRVACSRSTESLPSMASLLGGVHDFADKAARTLGAAMTGPDAARPDPDVIVAARGHAGASS
jgi:hypothetical protein